MTDPQRAADAIAPYFTSGDVADNLRAYAGERSGWCPIETAPRDGRCILVGHSDCGVFQMAWDARATNELFAPGVMGLWVTLGGDMTWNERGEGGPSHWHEFTAPSLAGWPPAVVIPTKDLTHDQ